MIIYLKNLILKKKRLKNFMSDKKFTKLYL